MTNKDVKKKELLQKYYNQACHNVFCYSKNYGMSIPKEGFEKRWTEANEECDLLKEMIEEMAAPEIATQKQPEFDLDNNQIEEARAWVNLMLNKEVNKISYTAQLIGLSHATLSLFMKGHCPWAAKKILTHKNIYQEIEREDQGVNTVIEATN